MLKKFMQDIISLFIFLCNLGMYEITLSYLYYYIKIDIVFISKYAF